MHLPLTSVGKYTQAQRGSQVLSFFAIGFNVSGNVRGQSFFPDGRCRNSGLMDGGASLSLIVPGCKSIFEYNDRRENWMIFLTEPAPFRYDSGQGRILCTNGGGEFPVPHFLTIARDEISPLRRQFQNIRQQLKVGTPRARTEAELLTGALFLRFLESDPDNIPEDDPAERFHLCIDADPRWSRTLAELAREAGLSRDSARDLFLKRFGVTPGEYRIRKRLDRIITLIAETDRNMRTIATDAGLTNVTYLNALTRKYFHATPMELCRKFRHPNAPD